MLMWENGPYRGHRLPLQGAEGKALVTGSIAEHLQKCFLGCEGCSKRYTNSIQW